jgi:predicted Fe-Mo cluster-binding NifX family protein
MMKIAAVTDDGTTISAHFGRATKYAVLTVEDGRIIARELRDKAGHRDFEHEVSHGHGHHDDARGRGFGEHAGEKHRLMFEAIPDCQMLLARGMGQGAYQGLQQRGIRPILTEILDIDTAVQAVIDGTIEDHPERLH